MEIYESFSEDETFDIAKEIAKKVKPGSVICLDGDLGTGKTAFAKGFAKGMGVQSNINSPTFTLVQRYTE